MDEESGGEDDDEESEDEGDGIRKQLKMPKLINEDGQDINNNGKEEVGECINKNVVDKSEGDEKEKEEEKIENNIITNNNKSIKRKRNKVKK